jgi:RHS repeat-associated protein
LDYFLARYYSSAQGRFTSPDEFTGGPHEFWILGSGEPEDQALTYADITEPQSLNKYQYCLDNPLRYVDPDGHDPQDSDDKARRAAQGAAAHSGRTLTHDGRLRREYNRRAQELRGKPGASEARAALQKEIRQRSTPLGKGVADAAAKSREGQLAGKTAGQLAESASRTNKGWNKIGAVSEGVGKATLVVGVGISVYNVATAENKAEAVTEEAGAWGGALAGGAAGAKLGGAIGTVIEPGGGTAIGAGAGGVLGGIGGAIAGSKLGKAVYGWVERKVQDTLCSGCL